MEIIIKWREKKKEEENECKTVQMSLNLVHYAYDSACINYDILRW